MPVSRSLSPTPHPPHNPRPTVNTLKTHLSPISLPTTSTTMPSISQLIPPFPSHLPTASLEVFDFDRLLGNDPDETQRLFATCKDKGFFYLRNHNVDVLSAFQFGKDLMDIPLEEKQKYAMGTGSNYMGYKAIGGIVVDKKGTPDSNETWNVPPEYTTSC
jgi:hypothetical protein